MIIESTSNKTIKKWDLAAHVVKRKDYLWTTMLTECKPRNKYRKKGRPITRLRKLSRKTFPLRSNETKGAQKLLAMYRCLIDNHNVKDPNPKQKRTNATNLRALSKPYTYVLIVYLCVVYEVNEYYFTPPLSMNVFYVKLCLFAILKYCFGGKHSTQGAQGRTGWRSM